METNNNNKIVMLMLWEEDSMKGNFKRIRHLIQTSKTREEAEDVVIFLELNAFKLICLGYHVITSPYHQRNKRLLRSAQRQVKKIWESEADD